MRRGQPFREAVLGFVKKKIFTGDDNDHYILLPPKNNINY